MAGTIWEDKAQEKTHSMQCSILESKSNIEQNKAGKEKIT